MNQGDQEKIEKTSITKVKSDLVLGDYIIEKEYHGRIISIRLPGHSMDNSGKYKNCEIKFIDGKEFIGVMHEDDYFTLVQKAKGREKITIASSETCHLILDEIRGKLL